MDCHGELPIRSPTSAPASPLPPVLPVPAAKAAFLPSQSPPARCSPKKSPTSQNAQKQTSPSPDVRPPPPTTEKSETARCPPIPQFSHAPASKLSRHKP